MNKGEIEWCEIEILLEAIRKRYGYDFRNYARASLRRRIQKCKADFGLEFISELIPKVLNDQEFFTGMLQDLSVTVTQLFRDPHFYRGFREKVVPVLKTYATLKIWHAGCATGEEAYSMAILLHEEGLLERATLYATDFNVLSLRQAQRGIYSLEIVRACNDNYEKAGGKARYERGLCPTADDLFSRVVTVSLNQWYSAKDCRNIAGGINKVLSALCTPDPDATPWRT